MNKQVVKAFRKVGREKLSGVLTCHGVGLTRQIILHEGGIVGARSSNNLERLGEVLVRHGHITEQHLTDASLFVNKGRRLGETLVELRIIKREDVENLVRLQVLELGSMVVYQPPTRLVLVTKTHPSGELSVPINVLDVVMEAARRTPRIEKHIKTLVEDDRHLSLTSGSMALMGSLDLKPEEAFILSRVSGNEPPRSVFALSPLSEEDTARAVLGHLFVGILELKADPNLQGLQAM